MRCPVASLACVIGAATCAVSCASILGIDDARYTGDAGTVALDAGGVAIDAPGNAADAAGDAATLDAGPVEGVVLVAGELVALPAGGSAGTFAVLRGAFGQRSACDDAGLCVTGGLSTGGLRAH
jgi:hypothetical protein